MAFRSDNKRLARQNYPTDDLTLVRDVPYINDGTVEHLLDIYYPKVPLGKLPVIIDIHGGGLMYGDKELNRFSNHELARRGFAVINVSYRLIPTVYFWDQMSDILAVFRFVETLSDNYPLDLSRVYCLGDSAGGLLTFMSVAINQSEELQTIFDLHGSRLTFKAIGLVSTMLETRRKDFLKVIDPYITTAQQATDKVGDYLQKPALVLRKTKLPPCWLVTSSEDFLHKESLELKALLDEVGVENMLIDWPKGKGRTLQHVFQITYPKYPESQQMADSLTAFFKAHG